MNVFIVLLLLLSHYISDFLCQNDWMAHNKSSSNKALIAHTAIYTFTMFLFLGIIGHLFSLEYMSFKFLWFFPITFVAHTITDYYTSRLNKKLWEAKQSHWFFVGIGGDQYLLHVPQLLLTYYYLVL